MLDLDGTPGGSPESGAYEITKAPVFRDVTVSGYTFGISDGFPQTGYLGAAFTLNLTESALASDYDWASDVSWVSVTNGEVSFISQGDSSNVTIKATPKAGGPALEYHFRISSWFISDNSNKATTWYNAKNYCSANNMSQPSVIQLTKGYKIRGLGSLWSEWGSSVSTAFYKGYYHWTSEQAVVYLQSGGTYFNPTDTSYYVVCYKGL